MNYASTKIIDALRGSADAIDEATAALTYIGLCEKGTVDITDYAWSIIRVEKTGNVTLIQWANGQCNYDLKFSDRASYDYLFKRF